MQKPHQFIFPSNLNISSTGMFAVICTTHYSIYVIPSSASKTEHIVVHSYIQTQLAFLYTWNKRMNQTWRRWGQLLVSGFLNIGFHGDR